MISLYSCNFSEDDSDIELKHCYILSKEESKLVSCTSMVGINSIQSR